ncbi:hypothetical protein COU76_01095 [Candidatus Peregrinibacteria bacterium CG10_big_fil_rev_8_21_14_0_10_49_10]|nr:MAG: hypothetical protein COU76_01095 [Candidatus Peregrinibacteria bacterium CG10_big_fil_rev_8_21_14_0_10_49_10]
MRRYRHIHRRRYGDYPHEGPVRRNVMRSVLLVIVLFVAVKWVLAYFGVGNTIQQQGSTLHITDTAHVEVSIEGGELKRAENEQKLYPGDRVTTGIASHAVLSFFDHAVVRLNELTDLTIEESHSAVMTSQLSLLLREGSIWISTPEKQIFSGSMTRTVRTADMTLSLPSNTESVVTERSLVVFRADGLGVTLDAKEGVVPVIVGEGQKFVLPPSYTEETDLYAYRSPLDPLAVQSLFVQESRAELARSRAVAATEGNPVTPENTEPEEDDLLSVTVPENNAILKAPTVEVRGTAGRNIASVRINGYTAPFEQGTRTFALEIALPDEDQVEIAVAGLDTDGSVLKEVRRMVSRDRKPPASPKITSPAHEGQTYRTGSERFVIAGTVSPDTISVIVNDYKLQLYKPGSTTWTYLASTSIDNLHAGTNVYSVVSMNRGGYRSAPAVLTVLLEEGPEGVVEVGNESSSGSATTAEDTESSEAFNVRELPKNAPLQPGSLQVTGPTPGTHHTATGSSFLIQGTTVPSTFSLWVNDYRLRLYEPGKTTWNYIADTNLRTLHRGQNEYTIVTRDNQNRILDTLTYLVEYQP